MIDAVMTGTTMIDVSAISHTAPPSSSSVPTRSHDISPRSRSHCGTAKTWARRSASISTNAVSPSPLPPFGPCS